MRARARERGCGKWGGERREGGVREMGRGGEGRERKGGAGNGEGGDGKGNWPSPAGTFPGNLLLY